MSFFAEINLANKLAAEPRKASRISERVRPEPSWSEGALRDLARDATTVSSDLEALERLSPSQPSRDQDDVRESDGRTGDGAVLRSAGGGVSGARRDPEPIHAARHARDSARGINPFEVRGSTSFA